MRGDKSVKNHFDLKKFWYKYEENGFGENKVFQAIGIKDRSVFLKIYSVKIFLKKSDSNK